MFGTSRGRAAGPGMEAGEALWPRWGRWYRLERAGLINKKRRKLGQRWGRRQAVC